MLEVIMITVEKFENDGSWEKVGSFAYSDIIYAKGINRVLVDKNGNVVSRYTFKGLRNELHPT